MIIASPDLEIFGVYDRGIPNTERIVIRVNRPTNLAEYFVILGARGPFGMDIIFPMSDQSLWLGATTIDIPAWIFIFTGSGKNGLSLEKHTSEPLHTMYWNKKQVVLTHADIVPAIIHVDHVQIGNYPNKSLDDLTKPNDSIGLSALQQLLSKTGEN